MIGALWLTLYKPIMLEIKTMTFVLKEGEENPKLFISKPLGLVLTSRNHKLSSPGPESPIRKFSFSENKLTLQL